MIVTRRPDLLTCPALHSRDALVKATMYESRRFFLNETEHRPSTEMLEALSDIPQAVSDIVRDRETVLGHPRASYFVTGLPTGVGKSVVLSKTIQTLRKPGFDFGHIGVLIAAGRYEQIEGLIEDMGLDDADYAVMVSRTGAPEGLLKRGLGIDRADEAPVLLTTHAMVETALKRGFGDGVRSWDKASRFFYQGKPRDLRCWDETCLPGVPLVLNDAELLRLTGSIGASGGALADAAFDLLRPFANAVADAEDHALIEIPQLKSIMPIADLYSLKRLDNQALEDAISLWVMSGRVARVRQDGTRRALLDFNERFPQDILPMLVLDASAPYRDIYSAMDSDQWNVVNLKTAPKWYDNLTAHVRSGGAGVNMTPAVFNQRVEDIAKIINDSPDKSAMVLCHKAYKVGKSSRDLRAEVLEMVEEDRRPIFVTWGKHDGVNTYRERSVLIMASTYFKPKSHTEVTGRSASGTQAPDEYAKSAWDKHRDGELKADMLQGLTRGCLRVCEGDQAKSAKLYLWAGRNFDAAGALHELFPHLTVKTAGRTMRTAGAKWTASADKIAQAVDQYDANGATSPVPLVTIFEAAGVERTTGVKTMKLPEMVAHLRHHNLVTVKKARKKCLARDPAVLAFPIT